MEKENLEIRKASEELTAEDLQKVNGGAGKMDAGPCNSYCPGKCPEHSSI